MIMPIVAGNFTVRTVVRRIMGWLSIRSCHAQHLDPVVVLNTTTGASTQLIHKAQHQDWGRNTALASL